MKDARASKRTKQEAEGQVRAVLDQIKEAPTSTR